METTIVVALISAGGVFVSAMMPFIQSRLNVKDNKKDKVDKYHEDVMNRLDIIQESSDEDFITLAHDKIYQECTNYKKIGSVDISGYHNLEKLYNRYKSKGGNGTAEKLFKEVSELPFKEE